MGMGRCHFALKLINGVSGRYLNIPSVDGYATSSGDVISAWCVGVGAEWDDCMRV